MIRQRQGTSPKTWSTNRKGSELLGFVFPSLWKLELTKTQKVERIDSVGDVIGAVASFQTNMNFHLINFIILVLIF